MKCSYADLCHCSSGWVGIVGLRADAAIRKELFPKYVKYLFVLKGCFRNKERFRMTISLDN